LHWYPLQPPPNPGEVDFEKDGTYTAKIQVELTIKGETNPMESSATVTVNGESIEVESTFPVTLADFGITFSIGKPSTNIANTVEVTVNAFYITQ
jgi:polyisoprenoid-binding protein YceI